jgi:thymidylate synthase ThyX
MSGTLRSWIHYIDVRADEGTQKEHRLIALAAQEEILKHFPSLKDYWFPEIEIKPYEGTATSCDRCFRPFDTKPWWRFWS